MLWFIFPFNDICLVWKVFVYSLLQKHDLLSALFFFFTYIRILWVWPLCNFRFENFHKSHILDKFFSYFACYVKNSLLTAMVELYSFGKRKTDSVQPQASQALPVPHDYVLRFFLHGRSIQLTAKITGQLYDQPVKIPVHKYSHCSWYELTFLRSDWLKNGPCSPLFTDRQVLLSKESIKSL